MKFQKLKKIKYLFESFEIYNEDIYDLMDESKITEKEKLEL